MVAQSLVHRYKLQFYRSNSIFSTEQCSLREEKKNIENWWFRGGKKLSDENCYATANQQQVKPSPSGDRISAFWLLSQGFSYPAELMNWKTIKNMSWLMINDHLIMKPLYRSKNAYFTMVKGQSRQLRNSENNNHRCCNRTKRWCLLLTNKRTRFTGDYCKQQCLGYREESFTSHSVPFSLGVLCCQVGYRKASAWFYFKTHVPKRIFLQFSCETSARICHITVGFCRVCASLF